MAKLGVVAALVCAAAVWAGAAGVARGPEIGAAAPGVGVVDQNGQGRTLRELLGPKGMILIVFQSADWCAYCKNQLEAMERAAGKIRAAGLGLAGLSYDSAGVLKAFASRKGIGFPLLADPESKLIGALGMLNPGPAKGTPYAGVAFPGVIVLDGRGRVAAKYVEADFRERESAAGILMRRFGIPFEAARGEAAGKRLTAVTTASEAEVSPGERIAVAVEFELRPGMHVYAPGVEDYIPIAWKMEPASGWTAGEVEYPKAERLRLEAIGETVPAYTGKVRLTREIAFAPEGGAKAGEDVVLRGTLKYQACDDTMCYVPETLKLEWKLKMAALDGERVAEGLRRK